MKEVDEKDYVTITNKTALSIAIDCLGKVLYVDELDLDEKRKAAIVLLHEMQEDAWKKING